MQFIANPQWTTTLSITFRSFFVGVFVFYFCANKNLPRDCQSLTVLVFMFVYKSHNNNYDLHVINKHELCSNIFFVKTDWQGN